LFVVYTNIVPSYTAYATAYCATNISVHYWLQLLQQRWYSTCIHMN